MLVAAKMEASCFIFLLIYGNKPCPNVGGNIELCYFVSIDYRLAILGYFPLSSILHLIQDVTALIRAVLLINRVDHIVIMLNSGFLGFPFFCGCKAKGYFIIVICDDILWIYAKICTLK